MTVLLAGVATGLLWHISLVFVNDGLQRQLYRRACEAFRGDPDAYERRERVKRRARYLLSPFGRSYTEWWNDRRDQAGATRGVQRGIYDRAWKTSTEMNRQGRNELLLGCVLLCCAVSWSVFGTLMIGLRTSWSARVLCIASSQVGAVLLGYAGRGVGLRPKGNLILVTITELGGAAAGGAFAANVLIPQSLARYEECALTESVLNYRSKEGCE